MSFTPAELLTEMNAVHSAFHLMSVLNALIGELSQAALEIENAMSDLEKQGLFEQKSDLWILSTRAMDIAMHSLIPDIDQDAGDIVMETMSGSDLYLIIMNALS